MRGRGGCLIGLSEVICEPIDHQNTWVELVDR